MANAETYLDAAFSPNEDSIYPDLIEKLCADNSLPIDWCDHNGNGNQGAVVIHFTSALDGAQKTTLDGIIAAYDPTGWTDVMALRHDEELTQTFTLAGPVTVGDNQGQMWVAPYMLRIKRIEVTALEAISTGDFTFAIRSGPKVDTIASMTQVGTVTLTTGFLKTRASATLDVDVPQDHAIVPGVTVATGTQPSSDHQANVMLEVVYIRG